MEKEIDIKDKSSVYTSGSGGLFKAGIPIGIYNKGNLDFENNIKFFSKLSQLTFVQIVSFKEEEEY